MTVSVNSYLKQLYDATNALGDKVISSDFCFEIEGHEETYLIMKQAPWPISTPQGEIEVPTPLGAKKWQPQQLNVAQQGQIALMETVLNTAHNVLLKVLVSGGTFHAKIYEGTPQKYLRYKRFRDCFIQADPVDRDWENRSQPMVITGTLFYHYFGEDGSGNSKDYR